MEQELKEHLLALARGYAAARGDLALSTVGRLAADDWRFFERVQDDEKTFTARKYDEIIEWFSANWPDGAQWPSDVRRPQPANGEAA
jgi:hypothetical protein